MLADPLLSNEESLHLDELTHNAASKESSRNKHVRHLKLLAKIAACFVLLLSISSIIVTTTDALKTTRYQTNLDVFDDHGVFSVDHMTELPDRYAPTRIPERFITYEEIYSDEEILLLSYSYQNEGQYIGCSFQLYHVKTDIEIDTDHAESKTVIYNGNQYTLFYYPEDSIHILLGTVPDCEKQFRINGYLSEEEILDMADSIELLP